jgi:hypothetical protein
MPRHICRLFHGHESVEGVLMMLKLILLSMYVLMEDVKALYLKTSYFVVMLQDVIWR